MRRHHDPLLPGPTAPHLKNGRSDASHHSDHATPAERRAVSELASVEQVPTSFGVFKPVGWVMIGLPTQAQADKAVHLRALTVEELI